MSIPIWGQLQKSQDDPETIEEAIIRLIAVHNDDPESHLEEEQSLEAHKVDPVIDHPAGSVLTDKWSMTEFNIAEDFKSLSHWDVTGDVNIDEWPAVKFYIEHGEVNLSTLNRILGIPIPFLKKTRDALFQITAQSINLGESNFNAWWGYNLNDSGGSNGFGFLFSGGQLKAYTYAASSQVYSSNIAVDLTVAHIYRAHFVSAENKVVFYIDGVEVAELTPPSGDWDDEIQINLGVRSTASVDGFFAFGDLYFATGIQN